VVVVQRLRVIAPVITIAKRDEQRAVAREHQPRAEVRGAVEFRLLPEDHLYIAQRKSVEAAARDSGTVAAATGSRLAVAEIDQPIRAEVRMQRDIEQAALSLRRHRRHPGERRRHAAVALDQSQPSRPLTDQRAAIGQDRHPPRMFEAGRHGMQIEGELFALDTHRAGVSGMCRQPPHQCRAAQPSLQFAHVVSSSLPVRFSAAGLHTSRRDDTRCRYTARLFFPRPSGGTPCPPTCCAASR
jgi:hypothetical protein